MITNIRRRGLFQLRNNAPGFPLVFMLLPQKKKTVESEKDTSGPETCHDREKVKDGKAEIGAETRKPDRNGQPGVTHDTWDHAKPKGKWKEISAEFDAVGTAVEEKKNTWHESGKESTKRETKLFVMVESAATDEKQEERYM